MKTLCIAQCGHHKIWDDNPNAGPTMAKDAYTGVFAKKTQEYAKHFYPNDWCIISAKYGFLKPDDLIENYNVTFKDLKTKPITINELTASAREKNLFDYDELVIVASREYVDRIKTIFPGKLFQTPLNGIVGNGNMMKKLKIAIQTGVPIHK